MKGIMKDRKISCMISALCFVALGVLLVGWPEQSLHWICLLLGLVLLVTGVIYVLSHFVKAKGAAAAFQYDLILGVVLAILGVWLLINPDMIISFIQYVLGAVLIIHAVIDLQGALNLRSAGSRQWTWALGLSLITLVFGLIILFNPFGTLAALLMLVGIALIYDGISDLLILGNLTRAFRQFKKATAQAAEDATVIESDGEVEK